MLHGVWGPLLGPRLVTGWAAWGAVPSLCLRSPCFCAASPCRLLALEPRPEPVARASGQPPCPRRSPHQARPCAGLSAPGGPCDGGLREIWFPASDCGLGACSHRPLGPARTRGIGRLECAPLRAGGDRWVMGCVREPRAGLRTEPSSVLLAAVGPFPESVEGDCPAVALRPPAPPAGVGAGRSLRPLSVLPRKHLPSRLST